MSGDVNVATNTPRSLALIRSEKFRLMLCFLSSVLSSFIVFLVRTSPQ